MYIFVRLHSAASKQDAKQERFEYVQKLLKKEKVPRTHAHTSSSTHAQARTHMHPRTSM